MAILGPRVMFDLQAERSGRQERARTERAERPDRPHHPAGDRDER